MWAWIFAAWAQIAPEGVTKVAPFVEVTLGRDHGCGRDRDGTVACWGDNERGQLGSPGAATSEPRAIPDFVDVIALSAGQRHTCGLRRDGSVWCWGEAAAGQVGAVEDFAAEPVRIEGLRPALEVAAGADHTCARLDDGKVACWGDDLFGQIDGRTGGTLAKPTLVPGVQGAIALAAGDAHTCAGIRGEDGVDHVVCWGQTTHGATGSPPTAESARLTPPTLVPAPFSRLRGLSARSLQTCALDADGVTCWGAAPVEPGRALPTVQPPRRVLPATDLVALSVGYGHACALRGGGSVACWGDDRSGQLGVVPAAYGDPPIARRAFGVRDAIGIAAGHGLSCAPRDGAMACWGRPRDVERQIAAGAKPPILEAPKKPLRRALPPGTEYLATLDEILTPEGSRLRVVVQTADDQPCANSKLEVTPTVKGRLVRLEIGAVFLPGGDCLASPGPASLVYDLPVDAKGLYDLALRNKKREDWFQLQVRDDRVEILPHLVTFVQWTGPTAAWRVRPGSMAITCIDRLHEPMCVRRAAAGLPTCRDVLGDTRIAEAPAMTERTLTSAWFAADPDAVRISPDEGLSAYKPLFTSTWADGSGCLDLTVHAWNGEVWRNDGEGK